MSASRAITVAGCGAVSAAGWGVAELSLAYKAQALPAVGKLLPPAGSGAGACDIHRVPPAPALDFLRHPRLRRTSPISWFAAAAAMEAWGDGPRSTTRCGLVFAVMNACVQYSSRFFSEVLREPATASPLIFPETVFNAPASHLAVLCGLDGLVTTLIGGRGAFIDGVQQASEWLSDGLVDECLVVAAEEADWLTAGGLSLLAPDLTGGEGAGALLLRRGGAGPRLTLAPGLAEYTLGSDALYAVTGECMGAAAALQAALAAHLVTTGQCQSAAILTNDFENRAPAGLTITAHSTEP